MPKKPIPFHHFVLALRQGVDEALMKDFKPLYDAYIRKDYVGIGLETMQIIHKHKKETNQ